MRELRTRRGVRLVEGGTVISEILARPGPTHSVFDLLAAAVAVLTAGPRVALLGFAGGGVVAALRAMGFGGTLDVVDVDDRGERIFRRLSAGWRGPVRFELGEASAWLRGRSGQFDAIVEDLSITTPRGAVIKPDLSLSTLPRAIKRALTRRGVAVVNLLPSWRVSWPDLQRKAGRPYRDCRLVSLAKFENRVLLGAHGLPPPNELERALRAALRSIGSRVERGISVRELD